MHSILDARDGHADFLAAKSGDFDAADRLVGDLINEVAINLTLDACERSRLSDCADLLDAPPLIVPVRAVERLGVNQIPNAFAQALADRTGFEVADDIVQTNVVSHTRAKAAHRLIFQPTFDGQVAARRRYIVVDDHIGLGGTIANIRGHIETHGGAVIAVATLTASADSEKIALRPQTLTALRDRHGKIEEWWRERFGHGFDCLTEPEAGHLVRISNADTIRDRLAKAERQGLSRAQENGLVECGSGESSRLINERASEGEAR